MRLFGVRIDVRPSAAVSGVAAAAVAYALLPGDRRRVTTALASGLLWYEAEFNHITSHMISARWAGAPMDRVDWAVLPRTLYDDNNVTPQQHIGRAMGGPVGSAISMLIWWIIWRALQGKPASRLALVALIENTVLALGSWLPLPFVDGGVILRNIGRLER